MPISPNDKDMQEARDLIARGKMFEAISVYTQILARAPKQVDVLFELATLSFKVGQMESALSFLQALLDEMPENAEAWAMRAKAQRYRGDYEDALLSARKAQKFDHKNLSAWTEGARAMLQSGRINDADEALRMAAVHFPDSPEICGLHAMVLCAAGRVAEAYALACKTRKAAPQNVDATLSEIDALYAAGHYARVIERCREAVHVFPQMGVWLAFLTASSYLVTGDYDEGYRVLNAVLSDLYQNANVPAWNGAQTPRQHLVIYDDQGFGTFIQFLRFLPRVRGRATNVTLRVPEQMERLVRANYPKQEISVYKPVVSRRRPLAADILTYPLQSFPQGAACRSAMLSLPHVMKFGGQTDANLVPYLRPDPQLVARMGARLASFPKPRFGFVWAAQPHHGNDHARSVPLAACAPLIAAYKDSLVSLQLGKDAIRGFNAGLRDIGVEIKDFADTAAIIANLDVVITVDTSVAHLAGAMGVPVWIMLPFSPEWRWLLGREDSPWYPSARLFRQPQPGDWANVIARVMDNMQKLTAGDITVLAPIPVTEPTAVTRHPLAITLADA